MKLIILYGLFLCYSEH